MCMGVGCPIRTSCYRFRAEPNPFRQSYITNTPYNHDTQSCASESKLSKEEIKHYRKTHRIRHIMICEMDAEKYEDKAVRDN